uniref:Small ribosomal subunit protein mS31 n=2 Tax=Cacopsylla melanoneura TaxID=428564 RepID=A0A8D8THQ6_9HEMI
MIKLRSAILKPAQLRLISSSCILRKDDDNSSKSDAVNKLNSLLADLTKQKPKEKTTSKVELSKPNQLKLKKAPKEKKEKEPADLAGKLEVAAKKVADEYGGDTKQTESELLNLLLAYQKDPTGQSSSTSKPSLSDLLTGMKVERKPRPDEPSVSSELLRGRAGEVRQALSGKKPLGDRFSRKPDQVPQKVDLWSESDGLGIFDTSRMEEFSTGSRLTTWCQLHEKDLTLSVTHPPSNIFQQMILWTDQGKLWHFPINNEQGMDEEAQIDFTQHVMLDEHLQPWCTDKGPIRSFMELVLVGLSKNPFYTVDEKIEHIHWFRDYFAMKNAVLKGLALPEIEGGDPDFNIDVEVNHRKWGDAIIRPRKPKQKAVKK